MAFSDCTANTNTHVIGLALRRMCVLNTETDHHSLTRPRFLDYLRSQKAKEGPSGEGSTTGPINQSNMHKNSPHLHLAPLPNKFPLPQPQKHSRMPLYPARSIPCHQMPTSNPGTQTSVQGRQRTQPSRPFPPGSQQHPKPQNRQTSLTRAHRSTGRSRPRQCTRRW